MKIYMVFWLWSASGCDKMCILKWYDLVAVSPSSADVLYMALAGISLG